MTEYNPVFQQAVADCRKAKLKTWLQADHLAEQHQQLLSKHGNWQHWASVLEQLPVLEPEQLRLDAMNDWVSVGRSLSNPQTEQLRQQFSEFCPWRKGPFSVCGMALDTEWRSDLKWQRLAPHIQPLQDRIVLDVGCGNGYFGWRMLAAGAQLVVGIDPVPLFIAQFQAIRHFAGDHAFEVLGLRMEDVPERLEAFDTVFSMGVLYHRRSPFDHLVELRNSLRSGGELVVETLVINGELGATLLPAERYAKMHNVWLIPSCLTLESWLQRVGFINIQLVDVSPTTSAEQRATEWMQSHSLKDFLDPNDASLTCEGYPAPQRAIFTAQKK